MFVKMLKSNINDIYEKLKGTLLLVKKFEYLTKISVNDVMLKYVTK